MEEVDAAQDLVEHLAAQSRLWSRLDHVYLEQPR